ncbi:MAG TPA: YceI family protein [Saprospiraceae bacterium]|nr:YceI family protein [Saprospiraceae bacterium]HNM23769.1 YceI family protein [Saprospiraceae bacterium]
MAQTTWQLDPAHSEVTFRVRHLMVSNVSGKFKSFSSTVSTEGDDFTTADIEFTIETASIDTGVEYRDNHLRNDDFFNSERYPTLTFKGKGLKATGDDTYQLDGDLTIRDITKPVSLQVEIGGIVKDPYGNIKAGFEVTGKINRKEFGLLWSALTEAGGAVAGDEVKFQANIQYAKVVA